MNRLFAAYKPVFRSSNSYLGELKRKYSVKKAGFSGTLDPFASGCLIIATGQYTKLFRYLDKTPKTYRATLWLGASSPSLDIENIYHIKKVPPLSETAILEAIGSLVGELDYFPPLYSAKKLNGQRACDLARKGIEADLKNVHSTIYALELIHYTHPYIYFEATVSEGTYIRSIGAMIADMLGVEAVLSSLERIRRGCFVFENEKALDPLSCLRISPNRYLGDPVDVELGKKLSGADFENPENGEYVVTAEDHFAIIEIDNEKVRYKLNRIKMFDPTLQEEIII